MTSEYHINFTNNKRTLVIYPNEQNNETSLTLFGRDTSNWAYYFYANMLGVLENFCNDYPPGYANQLVTGQLWFDSAKNNLKICTSAANPVQWEIIANAISPELTNCVDKYNIRKSTKPLIPLTGSKARLTGALILKPVDTTSNNNLLATRRYVDSVVDQIPIVDNTMNLSNDGGTLLSTVHLPSLFLSDNYCATKNYVDNHANFRIEYDNYIGVIWDSNGYNTNYDDIVISRIPRASNELVIVNGAIYIKQGRNTCVLNLPITYINSPHCIVSGGLHEDLDWENTPNNITHTVIDNNSIRFERADTSIAEKVYFTISGLCNTSASQFNEKPVIAMINGQWITFNTLTADVKGINSDDASLTYEWYKSPNSTIPVSRNYAFTPTEVGLYTVRVFYKNADGDTLRVDSEPATVLPALDRPGAVSVTGVSLSGTYTMTAKITDPDAPVISAKYTWYKDDGTGAFILESGAAKILKGADTISYTPGVPGTYKVYVTYTDSALYTTRLRSAPFIISPTPVERPGYIEISSPSLFTGTILTATLHDDDMPVSSVNYQWYYNNTPITGGTSSTYTVPADKPGLYSAKATYSDMVGANHDVLMTNQVAWSQPLQYEIGPQPRDTLGYLTVDGKQLPGNVQTATLHDPDHVVPGSISYKWWNKGDPAMPPTILSTSDTFNPTLAGTYVVHVDYNDDYHTGTQMAWAETERVIEQAPLAQITGTISVSDTLTADGRVEATLSDPNGITPGTERYEWFIDGKLVPGIFLDRILANQDGGVYTACATYTDGLQRQEHVCSANSYTYHAPAADTTGGGTTTDTTGGGTTDTTDGGTTDTTDGGTTTDTTGGGTTTDTTTSTGNGGTTGGTNTVVNDTSPITVQKDVPASDFDF
jgi:hypothetical protein